MKVTSSRVMIGSKTYALANVNVVHARVIPPDRTAATTFVVIGVMVLGLAAALWNNVEAANVVAGSIAIGVAAIGIGLIVWANSKTLYAVRIGSSSGEGDALTHTDPRWINRIVEAINHAIVSRR